MVLGWTPKVATRHIPRVSFLLALLTAWLMGAPAWATSIADIDLSGDRITIRFDGSVSRATSFLLAGPNRIALDVSGTRPGVQRAGGGPVTRVRQAVRDDGTRVVFDLSRPAIVTQGSFDASGKTLTLDLQKVDDGRFAAAAAARPLSIDPPGAGKDTPVRHRYSVSMPIPPASKALGLPRIYGDDSSRPLVVIDAGHGGHDPGAISPTDGLREKDLTLKTALAIKDALIASGRVRVALTREDDRYLVLRERYGIARRLGANLFISIHCDSAENDEATGATAYTLSEVASDKEAARLAARENKSDIISGVDLGDAGADISSILIDLTQRETMNASASFARLLGREAKPLIPVKSNFHRMASLMVLKAPDLPSILFETGYISNADDAALLNSRDGRHKVAESVRRAVEIHFATRMAAR